MTKHILYSLTAIICALIIAAAYLIANRYDSVSSPYQRDNWSGCVDLPPSSKNPAKPRFNGNPYDHINP